MKNFAQLYKNGLFLFKIYIKMKQIKLNIKESHYTLFVQFLRSLTYVEIETKEKQAVAPSPNYDFSDLSGKLEWKGDAVTQQRAMRDEW